MEEEKAAAYYNELTRKGEGAAKFKQGLGFSSSSSSDPFPSKTKSSSSLFSNFVRASSPKKPEEEPQKNHAHLLDNIHNKLNRSRNRDDKEKERYDDKEREEGKYSRKSGDRERESSYRGSRRRRSRSSSPHRVSRSGDRDRGHKREMDSDRDRGHKREKDGDRDRGHKREKNSSSHHKSSDNRSHRGVDYTQLIEGYSQMTPAERVKAKMKLQLSHTAAKDTSMGMSTGWERFDFNKDAPLDDDDNEIEVAEDDISLVKDIGRSFRFSAVEARREEEVKAAHEQAMFGGASAASPVLPPETIRTTEEDEEENDTKVGNNGNHLNNSSLISDKVLSMQQGSWRDRARRFQNGSDKN